MKLCSITPAPAGGLELRVYEVGHAADSDLSRAASLKIVSTETLPSVASLSRLAKSYDGLRPPLSTSERCDAEHFTSSAKAAWLMRPSIQEASECDLSIAELCHWQSSGSSQKLCRQKMDLEKSAATIGGMAKTRKKRPVVDPDDSHDRPPRKLYVGEWLHRLNKKQVDVANALKLSEPYVSQIVSGRKTDGKPTNPSYTIVLDISDFLGISANDLASPPPPMEEFEQVRKRSPAQQVAAQVLAKRAGYK